jgi:peptidoglycan hydrolase-like protein with peptidoglycan-binding domain
MKLIYPFILVSVLCTSLYAVEYGVLELGQTESITIVAGDVLEPLGHTEPTGSNKTVFAFTTPSGESRSFKSYNKPIIVGPSTVSLLERSENHISSYAPSEYLFYKLTRASEVEYKNVNIVSLPSNTVGEGTWTDPFFVSNDLRHGRNAGRLIVG